MKYTTIYVLSFLSFASVIHGVEPVEARAQLPEFGDHELEIFQIIGHLGLYVGPNVGDTTNMNRLSLDQLEDFLTFTYLRKDSPYVDIKEIEILHDITNPSVVVEHRRRVGLPRLSEINKYMVRADAHGATLEVEVHVRESISSKNKKSYLVYVLQKRNGLVDSLIVLGDRGEGEGYRRIMANWYGDGSQK